MTWQATNSVVIGLAMAISSTLFAPIHRLAPAQASEEIGTGIGRFDLPDEQNRIELYQGVAADRGATQSDKEAALTALATLFENRRQYRRAAKTLRELVRLTDGGGSGSKRLEQIVGKWGQFEPVMTQPAGHGAMVEFRFRNGTRVEFTAQQIMIRKLLADMKDYLKSNPKELQSDQTELENLGARLVCKGQPVYLGEEVARWSLDLEPGHDHMDRRITVTTPLQKAGAYLLTANIEGGNASQIIVWLNDMAIVKKSLGSKSLYFVADSNHGEPIAKCHVEFFGYWQEQLQGNRQGSGEHAVHTRNVTQWTDENGLVELPADDSNQRYRWVAIATTPEDRLAYLGFQGLWAAPYEPQQYQQVKAYAITDRPLYRPGQLVKFKFWVRYAQYQGENESRFAGQTFQIEIRDPRNERVYSTSAIADAYGGLTGQWTPDSGTALGVYQLNVVNHGGSTFRVEEHKKREFEVVFDAPEKPIHLGDKFKATISARTYFGSPVTHATVKTKILCGTHIGRRYPPGPWDWLYGEGYGRFGQPYPWYPGWSRWGCMGPAPWWICRAPFPPELVAQREVPIGADGTVEVEIDTALAAQHHPDQDHTFRIEAEVVDQSRRVLAGTGKILAARKPLQVMVWTNKGYYRIGETLVAHFLSSTPDGKPVRAPGVLRLMKVGYEKGTPVETEVSRWDLATDSQGRATLQIKAADAGQYRLTYEVTSETCSHDAETRGSGTNETETGKRSRTIEGGHLFTIIGEGFDSSQFQFNDLELVPDRQEYAPGEKVALQINTNRTGATVLLFIRPSDGVYLPPKIIRIDGKSKVVDVEVLAEDIPNFFIEAVTIQDGKLHTETREILVPPVERILNVEVVPSASSYRPGGHAKVILKLTDQQGKPFHGSTVLTIYDKGLRTIDGSDTPSDIRRFFWKWRRNHNPRSDTNLDCGSGPLVRKNEPVMRPLGLFGGTGKDELGSADHEGIAYKIHSSRQLFERRKGPFGVGGTPDGVIETKLPMARMAREDAVDSASGRFSPVVGASAPASDKPVLPELAYCTDTALWVASLETNAAGLAEVEFDMPETLATWMIRAWGLGHGTRVGQGAAEVVTRKDLSIRP